MYYTFDDLTCVLVVKVRVLSMGAGSKKEMGSNMSSVCMGKIRGENTCEAEEKLFMRR